MASGKVRTTPKIGSNLACISWTMSSPCFSEMVVDARACSIVFSRDSCMYFHASFLGRPYDWTFVAAKLTFSVIAFT